MRRQSVSAKKTIAIVAFVALAAVGAVVGVKAYDKSGAAKLYHMFGDPYPRLMTQAFAYVDKQYVDPRRAEPKKLLEGAFKGLETRFPPVRIDLDESGKSAVIKVGEASRTISTVPATNLDGVAKVVNDALDFVSPLLEPDEKKEDVYYAALNGAVSELDPHSNAITPTQYKEFMISTRGSFGGIGFVFGIRDGEMMIISPIEGTPAARGGLRSGDRIVLIDGEPTINMPTDMAASKMRGEPGTQVTLTIARQGWTEPKPFTFTREIINVESVESYTLKNDGKAPTLMVRIKNFQKDTAEELKKAIAEAERKNPDLAGVIIDLRNNPGGLLDQAIELSDGLMDKGVIVSTRGRDPESQSRSEATDDASYTRLPVILLINQGSASASEIVSGALRSSRALLIGTKTFGKGSVQKLFPFPDSGALKLTVAQYLTANDVSIQAIGIQPDIMVYPAVTEEKNFRIGPPVEHMAEADLKNAFTDWGNSSEKPWREVQFHKSSDYDPLDGTMGDDDEDEKPKKSFAEYSKEEKVQILSKSFPVDLARRILSRVPEIKRKGADRDDLRKVAGPVLDEVSAEQNDKVAQALKKSGVEWTGGEKPAETSLSVTVDGPKEFKAGETAKFSVVVKNTGKAAVPKVWARTESKDTLFTGKDFVFGTLAPGEEKSWQTKFELPKSVLSRWDPLKIELHSNGAKLEAAGEAEALSRAVEKPEYAYSYVLADKNDKPELSGNGVIDQGDSLELSLTVENVGKAASKTTEVNIRGEKEEQLILKTARQKLENLQPGQTRPAPMIFKVEKADEEGNVKLDVSVVDTENNVALIDVLKWKLGKPYDARVRRSQPSIRFTQLPPLRTSNAKLKISATVEDEGGVKEAYAYLGDKKVYYQKNQEGKKKLEAKFQVELKPGSNFLVLAAGDGDDMVARKSFVVYLADTGPDLALAEKPKAARQADVR